MDDDKSVKLPPRGKKGWPGNGGANSRAPFADGVERMPTMPFPPVRKVKRSWPLFVRVMIIVLLLLVLAGGLSRVFCDYYLQSMVFSFFYSSGLGPAAACHDSLPSQ